MSPPALADDLIIDILLRLPPDDITCLARASLVCKSWHRLLSDRAFHHRYREIHGAPPFLGFLYNYTDFSYGVRLYHPLFLCTTPPSPFPQQPASSPFAGRPTYCRTLDCRHGRVLLHYPTYPSSFAVWDPVTGKQQCFSKAKHHYREVQLTAAVLCAAHGCDHLDCSAEQFLVVSVAKTQPNPGNAWRHVPQTVTTAQASLYSSKTGEWTVSGTIDLHSTFSIGTAPSLVAAAGDAIFFMLGSGKGIFRYDLATGVLSVIILPPHHALNMILCTVEDGGLGVAAVEGWSLRLLSGRNEPDGVWRWTQTRVIDLDSMIPTRDGDHMTKNFYVVGFAEGTSYIFVRANDSIFSVELKSSRITKIGCAKFGHIFPFMGFNLPDLACARL